MHNFKRKCYQELVQWKQQKRRNPLILQGARQVGKTHLIKQFASHEFDSVRHEQEIILHAYQNDFVKHAEPTDVMKITDTWNSIPKQLAKDNKKFKYAVIQKNARRREYYNALQWLLDAGLILPAYHVSKPALPLKSYASLDTFKIYSLDVGLLGAQSGLSPKTLLDSNALFTEFKGAFAENFVIQELVTSGYNDLFYWTEENQAEVDFILPHAQKPIPLEIKAGNNLASPSLQKYQHKFNPNLSIKASLANLNQQKNFLNLPLYLLSRLEG